MIEARPDGLSYIVDIGGREQLRSRHMLRPEPVSASKEEESERDGLIIESERDGPTVGVIPAPVPVVGRSQRLLEKNCEGNILNPASACVKAKRKGEARRVPANSETPLGGTASLSAGNFQV